MADPERAAAGARPVVGLSTYREHASWGVWETRADLLHAQYADAVVAAGGIPVLLPPAAGSDDVAHTVVSRIDALIISGGADVDPGRYGAEPHRRTTGWREDRDAWELALLRAADEAGLPTLGVCRGMQLMAVSAGGSLHQHTPDLVGHEEHGPGGDEFGRTTVQTAEGSRLRAVLGPSAQVARGDRATRRALVPRGAVAPRGRHRPHPARRPRGGCGRARGRWLRHRVISRPTRRLRIGPENAEERQ
jgi:putative glutamine amidotransferase